MSIKKRLYPTLLSITSCILNLNASDSLFNVSLQHHLKQKEYNQVIHLLQHVDSPLSTFNIHTIEQFKIKSMAYESLGQDALSYKYLAWYDKYYDSFKLYIRQQMIDSLENSAEKTKLKNDLLEQVITLQQNKNASIKRNTYIAVAILGLLISLGIVVILYRRYQIRQQKLQNKIKELDQQQQVSSLEMQLEAELEERKKIAQQIEKEIFPLFHSIKDQLEEPSTNHQTQQQDEISEAHLLIKQAYKEMQHLVYNTLPQIQTKSALSKDIQSFIEMIPAEKVTLYCHIQGKEIPIDVHHNYQLLRIIQELLQNSLKHSHASAIWIELHYSTSLLKIHIYDNGKKIKASSAEGLGWLNIQKRANDIGANIQIIRQEKIRIEINYPLSEQ